MVILERNRPGEKNQVVIIIQSFYIKKRNISIKTIRQLSDHPISEEKHYAI